MEKKKYPHTDPNDQVHSEFETSVGNNFKTVIRETPVKNDPESRDEPLNLPEQREYEGDAGEETPKKKVDKVVALIGMLSLIGLIGVIRVVKS
jgi:hypothetical protein